MALTDFARRIRSLTGFMPPEVLSGRVLNDTDLGQLTRPDRYALWFGQHTVQDYDPADFQDLPDEQRVQLDEVVRQFREAVSDVPVDAPPTPEQYRRGLCALGSLTKILEPYLRDGQRQRVGRAVDRAVRDPHVKYVAMYTWAVSPDQIDQIKASGVQGVLAKSMSADALVSALLQIASGHAFFSAGFRRAKTQCWPGSDFGLTARESEVAALLAEGLRNKEISAALWVSENTVKTHLKSIFQKAGVTSRGEAIVRLTRDPGFERRGDQSLSGPSSAAKRDNQ